MQITRRFTTEGTSPFDQFEWRDFASRIADTNGKVLFESRIEAPAGWSQTAVDILASKYTRKAGVPQPEGNVGGETSAKQIFHRLAHWWRTIGEMHGYFDSAEDAQAFEDEAIFLLAAQVMAPNSPQWFNTGLQLAYGLSGPAQGHYYTDPQTGETLAAEDAYTHPQTSACFIQSVRDDLVGEDGIMDLVIREARLFKYGSGTGTNFSSLRATGEPLSGGGTSSGLMSWLKIYDRAAGAVKSGGTTRRAAKMVILDADHPDIEQFVDWKVEEEKKVAALIAAGYSSDFNGEAYETVSGQNANNSVRLSHAFMQAMAEDQDWHLTWRTTGEVKRTLKAQALWERIAKAAHAVADPGVQFDTMDDWSPVPHVGRINGTNPCSEFVMVDDTACNLASINLVKFLQDDGRFDVEAFSYVVRLVTLVLEITITGSGFPTEKIARNSYRMRPLGLGYANLGALLMRLGLPYDSDDGRTVAAAITAIMGGQAYAMSALIAKDLGYYADYDPANHLRVLRNHQLAAMGKTKGYFGRAKGETLAVHPVPLNHEMVPRYLGEAAAASWDLAYRLAKEHGLRNAQVTLLAPTGTIGLLMDCDTTGVEPDFALVKFKKLAGGGYFKIVNQSVEPALQNLGYAPDEIAAILEYVLGSGSVHGDVPDLGETGALVDAAVRKSFSLAQAFATAGVTMPEISADKVARIERKVFGSGTIEGAPYLKEEHLAVFDCANRTGSGQRFIAPIGHVQMLGALQPYLSGGISKTVNMPSESTWEEVADVYLEAYSLGVKAVAIYRDGSKMSQPLSGGSAGAEAAAEEPKQRTDGFGLARGEKRKLPPRRMGITYELSVGGQKLFLRTGEYEDGNLGEIFIDLAKEGATLRSLVNSWAIMASKALQHGLPLDDLVNTFVFTRFEPGGPVSGHPNVKMATSLLDAVVRVIGFEYLGRDDFVQVPGNPTGPATTSAQANGDLASSHLTNETETLPPSQAHVRTLATVEYGDAPLCPQCGHMMIRNGACHVCTSCGTSSGCS